MSHSLSVFDDSIRAPGDWLDEGGPLAATSKLEPGLPKALAGRVAVERLTHCLVDRVGRAPAGTGRLDPLDPAGHDVLIDAIRALESLGMVRGAGVL
jgi:hypothetical protein